MRRRRWARGGALMVCLVAACSADQAQHSGHSLSPLGSDAGVAGATRSDAAQIAIGNAGASARDVDASVTGGAGVTGGASGTGSRGSANLDPNLAFDWNETLPGMGTCKAGKYTGMFMCTYNGLPVAGPITLEFTKSADGEFLELAKGQLSGTTGFVGFECTLNGRLDCSTLKFEAAAEQGVFGFGDPKVTPTGMFDGTLTGKLDTQSLMLAGDWSLGVVGNMDRCTGPWTAQLTP